MNYINLMYIHLARVVPSFMIGTVLLLIKKGSKVPIHFGRVYMILMMAAAFVTLFMPAQVGPRILDHFGWIHSFSFLTIYTMTTAYRTIKRKYKSA